MDENATWAANLMVLQGLIYPGSPRHPTLLRRRRKKLPVTKAIDQLGLGEYITYLSLPCLGTRHPAGLVSGAGREPQYRSALELKHLKYFFHGETCMTLIEVRVP